MAKKAFEKKAEQSKVLDYELIKASSTYWENMYRMEHTKYIVTFVCMIAGTIIWLLVWWEIL